MRKSFSQVQPKMPSQAMTSTFLARSLVKPRVPWFYGDRHKICALKSTTIWRRFFWYQVGLKHQPMQGSWHVFIWLRLKLVRYFHRFCSALLVFWCLYNLKFCSCHWSHCPSAWYLFFRPSLPRACMISLRACRQQQQLTSNSNMPGFCVKVPAHHQNPSCEPLRPYQQHSRPVQVSSNQIWTKLPCCISQWNCCLQPIQPVSWVPNHRLLRNTRE